tara:strand:+ start:1490 stop:1702 length:213 start_codon:yes stop_codon:yes gene_type:complete
MKTLLINIKNLLPYLFLIVIYFFFVNLEARKNQNQTQYYEKNVNKKVINENTSVFKDKIVRIEIPVIPFK